MDRLRIGTFLAPNIMPVYEAVTEAIGRRLGVATELVVETDYDACARDEDEVCFVCSLPYVHFERAGIAPAVPVAAPVLSGERYGGRPIYFSDVIVRADSRFQSFLDLRGHSWAYNEPLSQSGYGITRYHLLELGETHGFFSEVVEAGFHETSIRLVAAGEVDASAIDSQVLAVTLRDDPSLARSLRAIDALGPSTIQPVAVSNRVPEQQRREIRDGEARPGEGRGHRREVRDRPAGGGTAQDDLNGQAGCAPAERGPDRSASRRHARARHRWPRRIRGGGTPGPVPHRPDDDHHGAGAGTQRVPAPAPDQALRPAVSCAGRGGRRGGRHGGPCAAARSPRRPPCPPRPPWPRP